MSSISEKNLSLTIKDIKHARDILSGNVRTTPLIKSFYMTAKTGGEVYLKLENMQLTGSFKFRGAYNKIKNLNAAEKELGVIACSPRKSWARNCIILKIAKRKKQNCYASDCA